MDPLHDTGTADRVTSVGGGADYLDFVSQRLELSDWMALARVFGPRFVEVEGCVLWDRAYEERNFHAWWERLDGDRQAVEEKLNRIRLWQFIDFSDAPDEVAGVLALAHEIADSWRRCLREAFPNRMFRVAVHDLVDGPEVGFSTVA